MSKLLITDYMYKISNLVQNIENQPLFLPKPPEMSFVFLQK